MLIDIKTHELAIPFRQVFRHSAAERRHGQSLLVTVSDGVHQGVGEGCPREYVTGETMASATRYSARIRESLSKLKNLDDLRIWVEANREAIDSNPAAWCAHELALLDLFARREATSVERLLALPDIPDHFKYTAVIGEQDEKSFRSQIERYQKYGFHQFKLKISGQESDDLRRLQILAELGFTDLRLDANRLWRSLDALKAWHSRCSGLFCAMEDPLYDIDSESLYAASDALGVPLILDESIKRIDQITPYFDEPDRWILNIRVSKMGGLLRSLESVRRAVSGGLRVIVGAQVGESSLLTRAALPVAALAGRQLVGQEGAFGELLLERDPLQPCLQIGAQGFLRTNNLQDAPGWGLVLQPNILA